MNLIHKVESILPITVLVAIILFVLKEVIEYFKKKRRDFRQIEAIKELLSDELERNLDSVKNLSHIP